MSRKHDGAYATGTFRTFIALIVLSLTIMGLLAFTSPRPAYADESQSAQSSPNTVVKVGYFYNGGYMYVDDDGNYRGYDVEYIYTLAGYAGWDVQFVAYDNLSDCLTALENGDIDLVGDMAKTGDRPDKFIFSAASESTTHIYVMTRADDDRFSQGDIRSLSGVRTGVLKNTIVETQYINWCTSNGLEPNVVECDSIQERNAALVDGTVDAVVAGSTLPSTQKIAEFPATDLYFMLNPNRTDLKSQLDQAMVGLSFDDPSFASELRWKYFSASTDSTPVFSTKEKTFISTHPVFRVGVLNDDAPFSTIDGDGSGSGILPEYFDHLSNLTGMDFQCVGFDDKDTLYAALASGQIDAVGKAQHDVYAAHDQDQIISNSFLNMQMIQVTRRGTTSITSAATSSCCEPFVSQALKNAESSISLQTYGNNQDCFDALASGQVDAVICPQPAATWFLNRTRSSDYVLTAFAGSDWNICFSMRPDADGNMYRSILDKTLAVDDGHIDQLITSDTLEESTGFKAAVSHISFGWMLAITIILIALLIIAVIAIITLVRRRKREAELAARQAEADLREAQLLADEKTTEAQHSFFSSVSHDMRTPLNGVLGFTDIALGSDDPEKVRDYLRKIRTSGEILQDLVDDTLVMSRVESGKMRLAPTPNDNLALLERVCLQIRPLAQAKDIRFIEDIETLRQRIVLVDRINLEKIILNLLSNAIKFTPEGGTVRLTVRLDPADADEPDTLIEVSDSGIGMSEEFLSHAFEPFAQENPDSQNMGGTGLGLSIVKGLVDAMSGTIQVKSAPGRGSTFLLRLHFRESEEDSALPTDRMGAPDEIGSTKALSGKTFLVCEDNELNYEIIRTLLEGQNAKVIIAHNGLVGVETFSESGVGDIDAILMDVRMPVMDGIAATRAIRALDRADAGIIPIIAVSADAYPEDTRNCVEAGMNGHISKPINPAELIATLSAI